MQKPAGEVLVSSMHKVHFTFNITTAFSGERKGNVDSQELLELLFFFCCNSLST